VSGYVGAVLRYFPSWLAAFLIVILAVAAVLGGLNPLFVPCRTLFRFVWPFVTRWSGTPTKGSRRAALAVGEVPQGALALQLRPELLRLLAGAANGPRGVYVLTGARGTGKTQVAGTYARQRLSQGWRLVAWVSAGDRDSVLAGLAEIARALGFSTKGADAEHVALWVRHQLEADGARCLVVFDDVADPGGLWRYLPSDGDAQVVITTTLLAAAGLGTAVPVDVFTMPEALQFLACRAGLADQAARHLAGDLGCLPLALAHAAALITGQRLDCTTYLARLQQLPVGECLPRAELDPYPRETAEAVGLMLHAAEDADETGASGAVMDLIAVLSPAGTPRWILRAAARQPNCLVRQALQVRHRPVTLAGMDAAVGLLADASLLTFSAGNSVVTAHRLTARIVRERQAAEGTADLVGESAASLLSELVSAAGQPWADRARTRELARQVEALRAHAGERPDRSGLPAALVRLGMQTVELLSGPGGDPARVVHLGEPLSVDCERMLGADHPDSLTLRGNLARAYRMAGRTEEAIKRFGSLLVDCQRLHGSGHPATLAAQSELAGAYESVGQLADAMPLYVLTLSAREQVLGPDHPDSLASRHNLAFASHSEWRLGRLRDRQASHPSARPHAESLPLYERALDNRERVLGTDHPSALASRTGITSNLSPACLLEHALWGYRHCHEARAALLGSGHPDTLATLNNLACTYGSARQPAVARRLLHQALAGRERVLGPGHPDTLDTRNNLAYALQAAGQLPKAITQWEQILSDSEQALGGENAQTLAFCDNLALAYRIAGYSAKANALYERATDDRERTLTRYHPIAVISRKNLAMARLSVRAGLHARR
jgi:tetratricopeptide (TPR) repeat protein